MTDSQTLPAGTWTLDVPGTAVTVTVKKLGFITVAADMSIVEGSISIDEAGVVTAVNVVLDAASYSTGNDKRDEHVRTADFLDAETYPHLTFSASDVVAAAAGYKATGTVTVKGSTSPLSFDISAVTFDETAGSFTAATSVDRNAIGVDKMPSLVIGNELQIAVSARAVLATG